MGGRGGSSGLNNNSDLGKQIPRKEHFEIMKAKSLPELEGTEKQIAWAEKLRAETLKELYYYTIKRTSDGRPSGIYSIAKNGTDAIIQEIKKEQKRLGDLLKDKRLVKEKIDQSIFSYKDLAKRISIYNEIAKNKSASFWIDNRVNWMNNHMNLKFKKKIDG